LSIARPRILLVDNDLESLGPCSEALRSAGYEVVLAFTSEEGLNVARNQQVDVAVVEWNLQGLDGYRVLGLLKEIDPAIEVILTSKEPSRDDVIKALRKRAADFLQKPINVAELRSAIEKALAFRTRIKLVRPAFGTETANRLATLSDREYEVLNLVSQGLSTKDISLRLKLSIKTVRNHLASIYGKLGVTTRTQAGLLMQAARPADREST
jgi:DNA-binding NarL/FixJ family response regulator